MTDRDRTALLRELIEGVTGRPFGDIGPDTLIASLGIDSVTFAEIVVQIEDDRASGFLGGLAAAALMAREHCRVVLPSRAAADPSHGRQRLRGAILACGVPEAHITEVMQLATVTDLPPLDRFGDLDTQAAAAGADEIVHCAGCVDYFDENYTGKNCGLYQMWRAIEGLLCREYSPVWHTIAPPVPVNLLHQDAFQNGFLGIYWHLDPGAIVHLVSDDASSPTLRELTWLWADVHRPAEIRSYAGIDDVPLAPLPRRQRRFLELAWKNFEIATRPWRFETTHLTRLRQAGLPFPDVTLQTVARCQQRYIENSPKIQEHTRRYGGPARMRIRLTEFDATASSRAPSRGEPCRPT